LIVRRYTYDGEDMSNPDIGHVAEKHDTLGGNLFLLAREDGIQGGRRRV